MRIIPSLIPRIASVVLRALCVSRFFPGEVCRGKSFKTSKTFAPSLLLTPFFATLLFAQASSNQKIFEQASQALHSGDYAAAESGFRQILKTDPQNIGALGNLGVVYAHTHRYAKGIEVYKRGLALSPMIRACCSISDWPT